MKKVESVERTFCDECGKPNWTHPCLKCGKDICTDCGVEYPFSVNFSGSDDGYYCKECDRILTETQDDILHNAYVNILVLRNKGKKLYSDFQNECKIAEKTLKKLLGE